MKVHSKELFQLHVVSDGVVSRSTVMCGFPTGKAHSSYYFEILFLSSNSHERLILMKSTSTLFSLAFRENFKVCKLISDL